MLGPLGGRQPVEPIQPQREFVAPQPRHQIRRPHHPAQHRAGQHERGVARLMAEPVVQRLQPVQVDEHQRARQPLPLQPVDPPLRLVDEGAPVQQARERVRPGLAGQLPLDRLVLEHDADQGGHRAEQQVIVAVPSALAQRAPHDQRGLQAEPGRAEADQHGKPAIQRQLERRRPARGPEQRQQLRHQLVARLSRVVQDRLVLGSLAEIEHGRAGTAQRADRRRQHRSHDPRRIGLQPHLVQDVVHHLGPPDRRRRGDLLLLSHRHVERHRPRTHAPPHLVQDRRRRNREANLLPVGVADPTAPLPDSEARQERVPLRILVRKEDCGGPLPQQAFRRHP